MNINYHITSNLNMCLGKRAEELQRLSEFIYCDQKQSWWAVTGEGGHGKSRLLLELLKHLSNDWFGFFGETTQ